MVFFTWSHLGPCR